MGAFSLITSTWKCTISSDFFPFTFYWLIQSACAFGCFPQVVYLAIFWHKYIGLAHVERMNQSQDVDYCINKWRIWNGHFDMLFFFGPCFSKSPINSSLTGMATVSETFTLSVTWDPSRQLRVCKCYKIYSLWDKESTQLPFKRV